MDLWVWLLMTAVLSVWTARFSWRGRSIGAVFMGLFALAVLWKVSSVRASWVGPTLLRVETDAPLVALTFDDGPSSEYTKTIMDLLAVDDVRATFFLVGRSLEAHPELGRDLLEAGHELGNHSWDHDRMIFQSDDWMRSQVSRTDDLLRSVGVKGEPPFRPPFGKRLWGLHHVLGDRPAVLWDVEPESFPEIASDPVALAAHVVERAEPGSIILLHAMFRSRQSTRDALPLILEGLKKKGLRPTTLAALEASRWSVSPSVSGLD